MSVLDLADVRHIAYSPAEAAAMVGLSRETVRRHVHSGRIDARRDGDRILITHEALVRFVESLPAVTSAERLGAVPDESEAPGVPAGSVAPAPPVVVGEGPTGTSIRMKKPAGGASPAGR